MRRAFISYPQGYKSDAEEIMKGLNKNWYIKAEISPLPEGTLEYIPKEVSDKIKSANYFVLLYPTAKKNSQFVNQELGFAYSLYLKRSMCIIPLFQERDDFEGFITPNSEMLNDNFKLNVNEDGSIMNLKSIIENIECEILRRNMYPIQLKKSKITKVIKIEKGTQIYIETDFEVTRNMPLLQLRVVFVIPTCIKITFQKINESVSAHYFLHPLERHDIPTDYKKFFNIEVEKYIRLTFIQKERYLDGTETHKLSWIVTVSKDKSNFKETTFGMYFRHDEFQEEFYKFRIFIPEGKKSKEFKIEHNISKGKDHIPIPISFKLK